MSLIKNLLFFYLFVYLFPALGQEKEDSTYIIYKEQLGALFRTRGMDEQEISNLMNNYRSNEIKSHKDFAQLLGTLYPSNKGIGILLFFYQKDTLTQLFFTPGRLISERKFFIGKEELSQINKDIVSALGIQNSVENRLPKNRGVVIGQNQDSKLSFKDLMNKAQSLLIPESFDSTYNHLIVVPAQNIGTFPFHLFQPYNNHEYLIDRCSFTLAPSLLDLIGLRSRLLKDKFNLNLDEHLARRNVFSDFMSLQKVKFTFEKSTFIVNPEYPKNSAYIFPDLPGAEIEVESICKLLPSPVKIQGKKAIKSEVISLMNGTDLTYFATHGIASELNPMQESYLVLSEPDPYLNAKDIMDLRHNDIFDFPEMVVLSACQTGLGKSMDAGIVGLARPFLIGGSKHVIMSLWNVDDHATAFLMSRFMHHLLLPYLNSPAEPLRQAIIETKKVYPQPSHWASFSLFGVNY
ncbi:MAG: CHAT domain-containing protein [Crocinitomicaceae bacterium]